MALSLLTSVAQRDEVVEQALRIIRLHDMMHPDPKSLAQESPAALLASLRRTDPRRSGGRRMSQARTNNGPGRASLGSVSSVIADGSRILFVPLPGGALTRAGIAQPVRVLALAGQAADPLGLDRVQQMLGDPARDTIEATVQDLTDGPVLRLVLKRSTYEAVAAERIDTREGPILRIHRFVQG